VAAIAASSSSEKRPIIERIAASLTDAGFDETDVANATNAVMPVVIERYDEGIETGRFFKEREIASILGFHGSSVSRG
jgi:hypothetical protein